MSKHVKALAISLFFWSWSSWTRPMEFPWSSWPWRRAWNVPPDGAVPRLGSRKVAGKELMDDNSFCPKSGGDMNLSRDTVDMDRKAAWFVFWLMLACVCYCARGRSGKQQTSMESMFMKWADQDTCKNIRPLTTVQPILLEPVHANKPLSHSTGQQGSSSPQPSFRWLSFICCSSKLDCWIVGVE